MRFRFVVTVETPEGGPGLNILRMRRALEREAECVAVDAVYTGCADDARAESLAEEITVDVEAVSE